MNTLLIYDKTGYILFNGQGSVREPQGIPFLWVEIPTGKQLKLTDGIGVDVSVTPNLAILEDIPKTEMELVKEKLSNALSAIDKLMDMI